MKPLLPLCLLATLLAPTVHAREWFVRQSDPKAADTADGSTDHPLKTINAAAQLAQPGDIVTVGAGIYHEWISPARGGGANAPIVYRSLPEHAAIVRGTDVFDEQWQAVPGAPGVFTAALPQNAFTFGNLFLRPGPTKKDPHATAKCDALVFLQDHPLNQVATLDELIQTPGSWLSSNAGKQLLVHLQGDNAPDNGAIEITTRDRIFAPHRRGLPFIHVEGFVFERCATRPGFPQLGAVSARSGQYWIIRNNIVRQTTGRGIDCGSETYSPESLIATEKEDKHIMIAGHNRVEGNLLSDNAEGGIAAWNTDFVHIINNIVRDNCTSALGSDHSLVDFEAGAIKVHCFRNGLIEGNLVINNSSFGIWLDDGWENTRVTRNVCIGNHGLGIFVEFGFGPILVDHNLCAANVSLDDPYFGQGIYCHDGTGVTITHNTCLENASYGVEQIVVAERAYGSKLAEASNGTITANLLVANKTGAIFLPLTSARSHDNVSDYNAVEPTAHFGINNNQGRIPMEMIFRECRDRLQTPGVPNVPENQRPDLSDTKKLPVLSLAAWRVVMQMDQNTTLLPEKFHMHLDPTQLAQNPPELQIDMPSIDAIPTVPPGPSDDFDLLGQPIAKNAKPLAGAIQNLLAGTQTIHLWPLPAVPRPSISP